MMDQAPLGNGPQQAEALPPSLRFLKWLVILLTLTMIVGVITVVALIVTRMPQQIRNQSGPPAAIAQNLALPPGSTPKAVTMGDGWIAVVTDDDRILIYGTDGALWQEVEITRP